MRESATPLRLFLLRMQKKWSPQRKHSRENRFSLHPFYIFPQRRHTSSDMIAYSPRDRIGALTAHCVTMTLRVVLHRGTVVMLPCFLYRYYRLPRLLWRGGSDLMICQITAEIRRMGSTVKLLIGKPQVRFANAYVDTHFWGLQRGYSPLLCFLWVTVSLGYAKEMVTTSASLRRGKMAPPIGGNPAHCVGKKVAALFNGTACQRRKKSRFHAIKGIVLPHDKKSPFRR